MQAVPALQAKRHPRRPGAAGARPAGRVAPGNRATEALLGGDAPMSAQALTALQRQAGNSAVTNLVVSRQPDSQQTQDSAGGAPQPQMFEIIDRVSHQHKMVNEADYELERVQLGRLLKYMATDIPKDAKQVLDDYPYESIGDKYKECAEANQTAGRFYSRGDLLMARAWTFEAKKYTDLELEAHKLFQDENVFSYVGKRLAFAAVGFLEGAADAVLGLVDTGAGLFGYHPGLVEWNTKRYETIKGGLGGVLNLDPTHIDADEIGRMGGKVAAGLALGKTLQGGGIAGQGLMLVTAAGGIKATAENIYAMHEKGKTWGEIFSDPVVLSQCAGALAGATIAGAGIGPIKEFAQTAGLVLTATQIATATYAITTIDDNKTLSDDEKLQKKLDLLGDVLLNAGMTADGLASGHGQPELPPGETAPQLPAGETTPQLPAGETTPQLPAGEPAPDLSVGDNKTQIEIVPPRPEAPESAAGEPNLDVGDQRTTTNALPDPFEPIRADIEGETTPQRPRTPEEAAQADAATNAARETLRDPAASVPAKIRALRALIDRAISDYRTYRGAQRGEAALTPESLSGACGTGRDVTAENIAAMMRDSSTPVTIERYQIHDFGWGEQHGFLIVRSGGEAFLVDPTFGQFFEPTGGTGPAETMVGSPGGMETAGNMARDGVVPLTPEVARAYVRGLGAPPDLVDAAAQSLLDGDYAMGTEIAGNGEVIRPEEPIVDPSAREDVRPLDVDPASGEEFSLLGEIADLMNNPNVDPVARQTLSGLWHRLVDYLPYRPD